MFRLFLLLLLPTHLLLGSVDTSFDQLSFKERTYLSHFFRQTLNGDQLGFVLFFDKPISLLVIHKKRSRYFPTTLADKGWFVWKKYEHLFPHENFVFCEEPSVNGSTHYFHVHLVNLTNLRRVLVEHEALFLATLGDTFSCDRFILELQEKKQLRPLINHDECLYGILMGFGEESASAYKRRKAKRALESDVFVRLPRINEGLKLHAPGGKTYIKTFGIHPIAWIGNPSCEETVALQERYVSQCLDLRQRFRRKNPLRDCLSQLCSPG